LILTDPRYSPILTDMLLSDFDDEEQDDAGFSQEKDVIKIAKKPYEVDCKVLSPSDIQTQQDEQVKEVGSILEQPPEAAAILLRYLRWNKERLIETYMDKPEELLEAAGLGSDASAPPRTQVISGFTCDICCDDEEPETYALKCGHRYCVDCYRQYLAHKIKDEGEAARIQCPTSGCKRIVDSKSLDMLVTPDVGQRYVSYTFW
jgi:ariadne-1